MSTALCTSKEGLDCIPALGDEGWRRRSACLDLDPELFFPVGTKRAAVAQFEHARLVCQACPVRTVCLQFALGFDIAYGMWGGTTPDERRRIKYRAEDAEQLRRSALGKISATVVARHTPKS